MVGERQGHWKGKLDPVKCYDSCTLRGLCHCNPTATQFSRWLLLCMLRTTSSSELQQRADQNGQAAKSLTEFAQMLSHCDAAATKLVLSDLMEDGASRQVGTVFLSYCSALEAISKPRIRTCSEKLSLRTHSISSRQKHSSKNLPHAKHRGSINDSSHKRTRIQETTFSHHRLELHSSSRTGHVKPTSLLLRAPSRHLVM